MTLKLYNTLTGEKEVFEPSNEGKVKLYSCGQTIYEDMHVGNAKTYAAWDILNRYLTWKGYDVFHVMNITDVGHLTDDADQGEDKVEKSAKEKRLEPMELVTKQVRKWYREMDSLNMKVHNVNPRATGHMVEMIEFVKDIIDNGYAYEKNGTVYFDVLKFNEDHGYPKLDRRTIEDLEAGAGGRVDKDELEEKRSPFDFALWIKADPDHIMKWPSPWSLGYPGWHLECSVMSRKYLGERFDIHAGGEDHIFPHHPNERAQNMARDNMDEEPVRYWLHARFITVNGEKMSKSKGNFYTIEDLLDEYDGEVIRMYFAGSHYRSQSDFSLDGLEEANKRLERLYNTIRRAEKSDGGDKKKLKEEIKKVRTRFEQAMDDDMNTPSALTSLLDFSTQINKNLNSTKKLLQNAVSTLKELSGILGLTLESDSSEQGADEFIDFILEIRENLRSKNEYELADKIRETLLRKGVKVEDSPQGPEWHFK
ncbi:MAG: cysteine--tRNA ligase [Candidatus Saliniplasma sp.]